MKPRLAAAMSLTVLALAAVGGRPGAAADDADAVARGAYVSRAAGCHTCHSLPKGAGPPFAGGRALETPFGTFYSPNITPDPEHGIGRWSEAEFARALREGVAPDGRHYYPVLPYMSYSGMTDRDLRDLWTYLRTVPPSDRRNRDHVVGFPFNLRMPLGLWKRLFFKPRAFVPDPARDETWNRGAYLVRHLGHCDECHTPRNSLGALDPDRPLAGNPDGPEDDEVPNITPHREDGIGRWSKSDIAVLLETGILPDGDVVGGAMIDVVRDSTKHLTDSDRAAIAAYLLSLPPLPNS